MSSVGGESNGGLATGLDIGGGSNSSNSGTDSIGWIGDELRVRMRKMRLTLVLCLSLFCNMVFAASGFATTIGLYALLGYLAVLCAVAHLMVCAGLDQYDLHESVGGRTIYPVRVRTPLHSELLPYVFVWLLWWIVSELFHCALVLFPDAILWQFFFYPALAIGATWARSAGFGGHAPLLLLQIATLATLFFPTATWAPQESNPLLTTARVLVYFTGVLVFDYVKPPQTYHTLQQQRTAVDSVVRRLIRQADLEGGEQSQWREQITCVVAAYESVANENARAYEIATLNAWLLVSPFIVAFLGLLAAIFLFIMGRRKPLAAAAAEAVPDRQNATHSTGGPAFSNSAAVGSLPAHQHHHIATSAAFLSPPLVPGADGNSGGGVGGGGGAAGGSGPLTAGRGQRRIKPMFS